MSMPNKELKAMKSPYKALAIMITIKSKWCRLIENGIKKFEIRKNKALANAIQKIIAKHGKCLIVVCESGTQGKVPFQFWCDKAEEYTPTNWTPAREQDLLKASCLTESQLFDYCGLDDRVKPFYGIHISKLEVFDRPKELGEFLMPCKIEGTIESGIHKGEKVLIESKIITKAPQNYCFIESEE